MKTTVGEEEIDDEFLHADKSVDCLIMPDDEKSGNGPP